MRALPRLIACSVFRPALDYLESEEMHPQLCLTFLPSNLQFKPMELNDRLFQEITVARRRGERTVCLYGDCFAGMTEFCDKRGTIKVSGLHCFELLLGREHYEDIISEMVGTYFVDKDLLENFEAYCSQPLELF